MRPQDRRYDANAGESFTPLTIQSAPITLREKSLAARISGLEASLHTALQAAHYRAKSTAEFTGNALITTENAVKASFSRALFS
jgi:hypothetical protein